MEINRCELLTAVALLDGRFLSTKCCSVCRKPHVDVDGRARARARARVNYYFCCLVTKPLRTEERTENAEETFLYTRARARAHTHTHTHYDTVEVSLTDCRS